MGLELPDNLIQLNWGRKSDSGEEMKASSVSVAYMEPPTLTVSVTVVSLTSYADTSCRNVFLPVSLARDCFVG